MSFSPLISQLINALKCLPGVGPKSAQRMALYLLERDRDSGLLLAKILNKALTEVQHCSKCRILSETDVCNLCNNPSRDRSKLCVVESPGDVFLIEQTGLYKGLYFVLGGQLSPIDGIGPEEIGIDELLTRVDVIGTSEIIMATNSTVEGEATAYYIAQQLSSDKVSVSRIAHGVPLGGELEYVDSGTLAHAFQGRHTFL